MSLELIKEAVKFSRMIGEDSTQAVFENDIIVPDVKPDISRILLLDGEALVSNLETRHDSLLIKGVIAYKIIYVADEAEQMLKSINTNLPFSYNLDIPGAGQGMVGRAKCNIEHMEYEITNSRKINVKVIVGISGKVTETAEEGIVGDAGGIEGLQLLKSRMNINSFIGSEETEIPLKELLEVPAGKPAIVEVLRNDVSISGKEYKTSEGKVTVSGVLNIMTLYIGDEENGNIQTMDHEVPFSGEINLPGAEECSFCRVEYRTVDSTFEPAEDSDGELRLLEGEIIVGIKADTFGRKDVDTIDDAYSTSSRLLIETEPISLEEYLDESRSQIIIRDSVTLQADAPEISEVFNVLSKPVITNSAISDGKVDIEGVLENNVLYLANSLENPVCCLDNEIPFSHAIENKNIKAGMSCEIDIEIDNLSYSLISSTEVEVRFVIAVTVRMMRPVPINAVRNMVLQPVDAREQEERPSIILYFVQRGDTLWKIAKKYGTTIGSIQRANDLEDIIMPDPGEQLVIPWRAG